MKFSVVFILLSITLLVRDAHGRLSFEFFLRFLSPRNAPLHQVRRMEDANGDPYAVLDTMGLVEQYGYPAEEHNLTTKDGYNIFFYRVPGSPKSPPKKGKPVVFVQHGMLSSSDCFVLISPEQGLVFLLADAGYDVWLGNIRGNTYCRTHQKLTVDDREFWDFSWNEMALMDVSSTIDYTLKFTGHDNLLYIGHSMGTTMIFILLSEKPEYNAKVRAVVALAPAALWVSNPSVGWRLIIDFAPMIKDLADESKIYSLLPQTKYYYMMAETLCGKRSAMHDLCMAMLEMSFSIFTGAPAKGFNPSDLLHLAKYFPAGTSVKTLMHYQQCIASGEFKKYDHGPTENLRIYGRETPPAYDMTKFTTPIAIIYGNTDVLAIPAGVREFSKRFPNLITCEAVPVDIFNHMDFVVSANVKELLYDRVLDILSKY